MAFRDRKFWRADAKPLLARVSRRGVTLWYGRNKANLRLAVRVTVAGVAAFAIGRAFEFGQGYWAVFTAIIVLQTSTTGSLGAAIDYFAGTLAGAAYGAVVALVIPIDRFWTLAAALAVAIAPLAFLAAIRRNFRVAPITAAIVLLIPATQQSGVLAPAIGRVIEIAIGSAVGVLVSRFVLPSRAHHVVADVASDILSLSARLVALLFAGFGERRDLAAIVRLQDGYRRLLVRLDGVVSDAERERIAHFGAEPDSEPMLRTLRRIRFDLVIIGRAAGSVLPDSLRGSLWPRLEAVSERLRAYLADAARSLAGRQPAPPLDALNKTFADYAAGVSELRRAGVTRDLSDEEATRIFALGFALDQLRRNLGDLNQRVAEFARPK